MTDANPLAGLGWVLDQHICHLPHVRRALLLSADGLVGATSQGVERDMADRVAAAVSGLQALSRQAVEFSCDRTSPWEQNISQYGDGFLHIMAAGTSTYLVVAYGREADMNAVVYAMEKTIDRLGREMNLSARDTAGAA